MISFAIVPKVTYSSALPASVSCRCRGGAVVSSVPGEVLCSREVLVLLVTFDLWLSLLVCSPVFVFWIWL